MVKFSNESTDFRQVIIPLPLISNFNLSFTKYPSVVNANEDSLSFQCLLKI